MGHVHPCVHEHIHVFVYGTENYAPHLLAYRFFFFAFGSTNVFGLRGLQQPVKKIINSSL